MSSPKHEPASNGAAATSRWVVVGLFLIVMLAGSLRFHGITRVGLRFDDEGAYAAEARLWHRCAKAALSWEGASAIVTTDKPALQARLIEVGVDFNDLYPKPTRGYTMLGALAMFAVGDRPAALLVLNAAAGTLTVLALYWLAALWFGRLTGCCAALLLAASPYHLLYSRSALAEATLGLFVVLGALAWANARSGRWRWQRGYFLSGLAFGYATVTHYRAAFIPVLLLLLDAWLGRTMGTPEAKDPTAQAAPARRWRRFAVGLLCPFVAFEAVFGGARLAAKLTDSFFPVTTLAECAWRYYVNHIHGKAGADGGVGMMADMVVAFAAYFVHWQGIALAATVVIGIAIAQRRPGSAKWPVLMILGTVAVLALQRFPVARALSPALPFAFVCAAVAVTSLMRPLTRFARIQSTLAVGLTLVLTIPGAGKALALVGKRSCIEDASTWIAQRGGGTVALTVDGGKYKLYFDERHVQALDADRFRRRGVGVTDALGQLREQGVRWVIVDPQIWHYFDRGDGANRVFAWWTALEDELSDGESLAAEFSHLSDFRWEFLAEDSGDVYVDDMAARGGGPIRIYDLQRYAACVERRASRALTDVFHYIDANRASRPHRNDSCTASRRRIVHAQFLSGSAEPLSAKTPLPYSATGRTAAIFDSSLARHGASSTCARGSFGQTNSRSYLDDTLRRNSRGLSAFLPLADLRRTRWQHGIAHGKDDHGASG